MGGGLRLDPLSSVPQPSNKKSSRFAASSLRGFYLLSQGIFPNGMIKATSTQAITIDTETLVNFDTVVKDSPADDAGGDADGSMASLSNQRLYVRHAGFYLASAFIPWETDVQVDERRVRLKKNGSTFIARGTGGVSVGTNVSSYAQVPHQFDKGDYIEAWVQQAVDLSLNIVVLDEGPWMALTWVGL